MLYFQNIKRQLMEDSAITKPDTIQQYDGLLGVETLHPPVFHPDLLRGTELGPCPGLLRRPDPQGNGHYGGYSINARVTRSMPIAR